MSLLGHPTLTLVKATTCEECAKFLRRSWPKLVQALSPHFRFRVLDVQLDDLPFETPSYPALHLELPGPAVFYRDQGYSVWHLKEGGLNAESAARWVRECLRTYSRARAEGRHRHLAVRESRGAPG